MILVVNLLPVSLTSVVNLPPASLPSLVYVELLIYLLIFEKIYMALPELSGGLVKMFHGKNMNKKSYDTFFLRLRNVYSKSEDSCGKIIYFFMFINCIVMPQSKQGLMCERRRSYARELKLE